MQILGQEECNRVVKSVQLRRQQRITAIARFISGEIFIFGGIFYRDLSPADKRRRFDNIIFPCIELNYQEDETVLKELYRRLNYGGTPHTQEDLALLKP
ncbi:hypothetical protein ACQCLI_31520 (plasmid) [Pseudomonas nitroreducens]|uniref:hypothetical protein n=1 Tax=Pseudomonas TaxID=286 RepID=UPI000ABC7F83|nr:MULTISPECIES: hypothetical protein [Pseudomonas]MDU4254119.1 hypothetical protein [Pseudomonas sp.]